MFGSMANMAQGAMNNPQLTEMAKSAMNNPQLTEMAKSAMNNPQLTEMAKSAMNNPQLTEMAKSAVNNTQQQQYGQQQLPQGMASLNRPLSPQYGQQGMSQFANMVPPGIDPSKLASMAPSDFNPLSVLGAVTGKMGEGATPCNKPPPPPPAPTPKPTPLQKTELEKNKQHMIEWLKELINSEAGSNSIVSGLATLLENNPALIDRIAEKTLAKIKEKDAEAAQAMPPPSYAESIGENKIGGAGVVKKRTKRRKRNKRKQRTKRRM